MKILTSAFYSISISLLFSHALHADCSYELFNISSAKNTKIIDFIEQLSDACEFTIIASDKKTKEYLKSRLSKTHIKDLTINEVLNIILNHNNLSYRLEGNILTISYLVTEILAIDYILSQRTSNASTDITLSSSSTASSTLSTTATGSTGGGSGSGSSTESGIKIQSTDEVTFWKELDLEFQSVINRPHDDYVADAPIINKNAGLITVTATIKQMARLKKYLKRLQKKVQLQVLIDVQILSVTMSQGKSTGVDWSQLYKLQNISLAADYISKKNVTGWTDPSTITAVGDQLKNSASIISLKSSASLNEVIKFLKTQGEVSSISNPKVLTLNNQPALITVGTEFFYKITSSNTIASTSTTSTQNEDVQSVFAGVLLDITPEISEDGTITLKINPSLSETTQDLTNTDSTNRKMPPDLNRRQLSSVVTVKDGNRIILGGLISTKISNEENQVPLLGDIPLLGSLFKYEEKSKTVQELIIVIEPHIIKKENNILSLEDLGYSSYMESILSPKDLTLETLKNRSIK
ncbi:pilus (MSHA type) biogenesis protein MshL [Sulfurimonas sp. SAG-AH-194-I05]|nr:pilus (MSHA type) biogenesis protein MshL [Sulfurimonas sp. SAG-AH-194-I05]MDF1874587.1 pilus (MSHA type) biogenesis protein MshL [Sulfurimonas sp. SAG-AH-194-I05]